MTRHLGHVLSLLLLAACTEHDPELGRVGGPIPSFDGSLPLPDAGEPGEAGEAGDADAAICNLPPADTPGALIPCAVDNVLGNPNEPLVEDRRCRRCHLDPQQNGAPFPLLTWAHTQALYPPPPSPSAKPIWQKMAKAVADDFMPFCNEVPGCYTPTVKDLTAQEEEILLTWLKCPEPVFDVTCP